LLIDERAKKIPSSLLCQQVFEETFVGIMKVSDDNFDDNRGLIGTLIEQMLLKEAMS
jgi:hypothetical protein